MLSSSGILILLEMFLALYKVLWTMFNYRNLCHLLILSVSAPTTKGAIRGMLAYSDLGFSGIDLALGEPRPYLRGQRAKGV